MGLSLLGTSLHTLQHQNKHEQDILAPTTETITTSTRLTLYHTTMGFTTMPSCFVIARDAHVTATANQYELGDTFTHPHQHHRHVPPTVLLHTPQSFQHKPNISHRHTLYPTLLSTISIRATPLVNHLRVSRLSSCH